ncbi:actin-related protein 2-like, partial [Quercus suber]|uniref:actin-related protein 2-like n=1 Tax=Quercus suber TaxID=58331 RepID=UPI0032DF0F5A
IDPTECKILLTDPPLNPSKNREKMVETMFEKYNFAGVFIQIQAVLTLYAQGLLTGLVIDSGDGVTHVVPVVDGYSFPHLTKRMNVAGRHITSYLVDLLSRRGCTYVQPKEKAAPMCDIMPGPIKLVPLQGQVLVNLGPYLSLISLCFVVNVNSLPCVSKFLCIYLLQLYQHIVLSGGSTMYPGLPSRLEKEILDRYLEVVLKGNKDGLKKLRLRIEDPPRRKHMVYLGGAVLAGIMKDAPEFWISREDYQEEGVACLSKCGQA